MFRVSIIALVISLSLTAGATSANAAVRSYFSPGILGDRIAFCNSDNQDCGKPVADAWCTENGFEKAILFQRNRSNNQSSGSLIRYADNGKICTGKDCISFAQIKCYSGE